MMMIIIIIIIIIVVIIAIIIVKAITVDDTSSIENVENFWKDIRSEGKGFDEQFEWIKHRGNKCKEATSGME